MKKILLSGFFALLFVCSGQTAHAANTVTCYNTCAPSFSNYVGTVILDLQCNASSPASYTGSLTVNGLSLSYGKTCNQPPIGNHETASCSASGISVRGWAYDRDSTATSIAMHFYKGGSFLGGCTANQPRPDVNTHFGITGSHGFNCTLPFSVGSHSITAYAIDTAGGANPVINNSPRTVTCTAVCTGSVPGDGTQCSGDTTGLSALTPWAPAANCTNARKCEYTLPPLTVSLPDSGPIQLGSEIRLIANPDDGLAPYGPYTWTGGPFTTPRVTSVHYVDVEFFQIGSFEIDVSVKDSLGQTASDTGTITVADFRDPQ